MLFLQLFFFNYFIRLDLLVNRLIYILVNLINVYMDEILVNNISEDYVFIKIKI